MAITAVCAVIAMGGVLIEMRSTHAQNTTEEYEETFDVELSSSASEVVLGERFFVRVTIRQDSSSAELGQFWSVDIPGIDAFEFLRRHQESTFQFLSGTSIRRTIHEYVLLASNPGVYELGPAMAEHAGRFGISNVITITVVDQSDLLQRESTQSMHADRIAHTPNVWAFPWIVTISAVLGWLLVVLFALLLATLGKRNVNRPTIVSTELIFPSRSPLDPITTKDEFIRALSTRYARDVSMLSFREILALETSPESRTMLAEIFASIERQRYAEGAQDLDDATRERIWDFIR